MENSLYIALSRQTVVDRQMETIANNLANASTPAYKGEGMMFAEHLTRSPRQTPLSFVRDVASVRNMDEGGFTRTENPLDLAIHGEAWFAVDTPQGERYTRNGHFRMDALGRLVTERGHSVLGDGGPITFLPTDTEITFASDGTVLSAGQPRGKLRMVGFTNPQQLKNVGDTLYAADSNATSNPAANFAVAQGMLEDSNVKPVLEITSMIAAMRIYQGAQRLIDAEHDRQRRAIDLLTKSN
jgi:flagellar basal-body rod protein FlgF